jgi:hypothetical protein
MTAREFEAMYKKLSKAAKGSAGAAELNAFLAGLPCGGYSAMLKEKLDGDLLWCLLNAVGQDTSKDGAEVVASLQALSKVSRFSMAVMFLTGKQKVGLVTLFDKHQGAFASPEDEASLRKLYDV